MHLLENCSSYIYFKEDFESPIKNPLDFSSSLNAAASLGLQSLTVLFFLQLLHSLLRLLNATDADVRLLVVQTFQILVDRHGNLEKLSSPTIFPGQLGLNGLLSKPNRADQLFVQKSVFKVYAGLST